MANSDTSGQRLRAIAASFLLALRSLLCGLLILVLFDLLQVGWHDPEALLSPHRYAAAVLPASIVMAALIVAPLLAIRNRLLEWQVANLRIAFAISIGALLTCIAAAWLAWTRNLQLPIDAALVVGTGAASIILMAIAIVRKRWPPQALLLAMLLWGAYIAIGAYHRILAQHALWPVLALWIVAATLKVPKPKLVAGGAALLSVLGLVGYEADRMTVARLVQRSVVSAPIAEAVRGIVDVDADGYSAILGGGDCDDFDAALSPQELEVVGNGKDDNCLGGDLRSFEPVGTGMVGVSSPVSPLPDIVILSLDAVRADYATKEYMPNLARLAKRGLHAPIAYAAAPHTGVSMVGLMTSTVGIDSQRHGRFFGYEPQIGIVLRNAGYQSVAIHCLADLVSDMVQGFDFVDNQLGPRCKTFAGTTAKAMGDLALQYLRHRKSDKPLFLWAHFTDPHLPYFRSYRQEVARVDAEVGRIVDALKPNSIVVVVSDHGESFGSHGFKGHIWRLDEEMIRVPLVIAGPGVPKTTIAWPTSLLDVAPTLTDVLGLAKPVGWQGASLLEAPGTRPIVFESVYRGLVDLHGIRLGDYKLTHDRRHNTYELYDVVHDPGDTKNLVAEEVKRFRDMREELGRVFDELHNDQGVLRKLLLLESRPNVMPDHVGPLQ